MEDSKVKHIPLSGKHGAGLYAIVDASDYERVTGRRWHLQSAGYAARWRNGNIVLELLHRVIMNPPDGYMIDHVNGDKLDNRRSNLRICTSSENSMNSAPIAATSRFKGVWREDGRWRAALRCGGKKYCLGRHDSEVEAAKAYDEAARIYFGDFARLNFPGE